MTRIERARRRVSIARYAIGITTVAALAGFTAVARASHPGSHQASQVSSSAAVSSSTSTADSSRSFFDDDSSSGSSSSIGPSGSATPQIQSGAS
ncbi:MAG: hypothetical protein ACXVRJ_07880 [Gaiellaceae bacterium]